MVDECSRTIFTCFGPRMKKGVVEIQSVQSEVGEW